VNLAFKFSGFSFGIFLAACLFTFLIILYSFKFMEGKKDLWKYYAYILITLGATAGAVFAADYITFLMFWGILALTLYLLVGSGGAKAGAAAKKSFVIVGGSDALMIFGIGLIWAMTGSVIIGSVKIPLNSMFPIIAFLSLTAGAFAKAGAMPFHTWIPDSAEVAPTTVMAYLPAALDKLLGIYFLSRICLDIFALTPNSPMSVFLMIMGSITIMIAVMSALVQHDLKKLLSFHAVSQVGYMILGIGTGIPVAVAGGIFHMFNNAIYKSLLFLSAGSVEKQAGTTDLGKLGGLAKAMPITFACALVGALSISGVPPLNGFMSKWMIYQGIIELSGSSPYWIIWLLAAMFGSALTLASFVKIIHATFLGQSYDPSLKVKESSWVMWLPMAVLASLCVIFGIFAYSIPLPYLVAPAVYGIQYSGAWNPALATVLTLVSLLIGAVIYYALGKAKTMSSKPVYIGGELLDVKEVRVSGINFYNTIVEAGPLPAIYKMAEKKIFDIYEIGKKAFIWASTLLSALHDGALGTYVSWLLFGAAVLFIMLVR